MTDKPDTPQRLDRYLANLGYGSRREVESFIRAGTIRQGDKVISDPSAKIVPARDHARLSIDGVASDPPPPLHIALHKPAGYVCSDVDDGGLSVYHLLPARYSRRKPGLSIAGRLDKDATGLVILTQDGQYAHTLMRCDHAKIYDVRLTDPVRSDAPEILASATLTLKGDKKPLKPVECEIVDGHTVRLTLYEGRYHQIKRMFAALGNRVEALHRTAIGDGVLGDLPESAYRLF